MRIVIAMSGGVDSTVSAALLVDQGHDVIGLSMQVYDQRRDEARFGSCCTLDDLHDARRVAHQLGIPHYIVNFERPFEDRVIARFVDEYLAGRTPIPCVRCNSDVKFATLLDRAAGLEAEALATGHYARAERDPVSGRWRLRRGLDRAKDQAYFLFSLTQSQLRRAHFPVGHMKKSDVRAFARERGLLVANKPDSHEICFVPDNDYASFIERRTGGRVPREGLIRDVSGRVLGRHQGVHHFTVGQRKGLGIATGAPMFVLALEPPTQTVVVGPRELLDRTTFRVGDVNWIAGVAPEGPVRADVQIRHRHTPVAATVQPRRDGTVDVTLDVAQPAVAPGQAAVFFSEDEVLGGGWIARDEDASASPSGEGVVATRQA